MFVVIAFHFYVFSYISSGNQSSSCMVLLAKCSMKYLLLSTVSNRWIVGSRSTESRSSVVNFSSSSAIESAQDVSRLKLRSSMALSAEVASL